jgi:ABC-type bacteriocin/lantibiotic exporter with double-glycine peptidase domain
MLLPNITKLVISYV